MVRARVLSFMSTWGGASPKHSPPSSPDLPPTTTTAPADGRAKAPLPSAAAAAATSSSSASAAADASFKHARSLTHESIVTPTATAPSSPRRATTGSRRDSLRQSYQPPVMPIEGDTPPELQPVFGYLNAHATKLYQEGYFLKLHDLDSRGRPSQQRVWNECFAQLVGTVLSLWDAAALDAAGDNEEVTPTFINLTDASIKMIESLPMNGVNGQSLSNVLSISTAANNRYLLHFNSLHSLTQWTAGIRLAMYEHSTLQEAYSGSILAAKGKHLNGIKEIMERTRFPVEDWARVRFGAGTPWRRCWCVIRPADEKEIQKAHKEAKKRSAYDRSRLVVKGDIKFYDTRKITKKTEPIATIVDAYAAYAIYPQSKALIDHSTLVKVEGTIKIHGKPESTTEGFVFVMPEVHPAVSGFEIMLRWLMPTFDTFALYGRPERLVANVLDVRSLMFAMPNSKRYGYLELIDVAGLVHTEGSNRWSEREWRKQLKNLTSKRMNHGPTQVSHSAANSISSRRGASRSSLQLPSHGGHSESSSPTRGVRFGGGGGGGGGGESDPSSRAASPPVNPHGLPPPRTDSAPPGRVPYANPRHQRAASDSNRYKRQSGHGPSRLSFEMSGNDVQAGPRPPAHRQQTGPPLTEEGYHQHVHDEPYLSASDHEGGAVQDPFTDGARVDRVDLPMHEMANMPVTPVQEPPAFLHDPRHKPHHRPNAMPDLRRANSTIDADTLDQLRDANRATRARTNSGARDDMHPTMAPGTSVMAPGGNPNYQYSAYKPDQYVPAHARQAPPSQDYANGYSVGGPYDHGPGYSRPGPPAGPTPSQQWAQYNGPPQHNPRRGPPAPDARQLPTIPGTPASEQPNHFDLAMRMQQQQQHQHQPEDDELLSRSRNSITRKPVPGR